MKTKLLLAVLLFTAISGFSIEWKTYYFVDAFGDPTDESYISTDEWIFGEFSNSATINSSLKVSPMISEDVVYFDLYEYNQYPLNTSGTAKVKFLVKDFNGEVHNLEAVVITGAVALMSPYLFASLITKGPMAVNITIDSYGTSKYNFKLDIPNNGLLDYLLE